MRKTEREREAKTEKRDRKRLERRDVEKHTGRYIVMKRCKNTMRKK